MVNTPSTAPHSIPDVEQIRFASMCCLDLVEPKNEKCYRRADLSSCSIDAEPMFLCGADFTHNGLDELSGIFASALNGFATDQRDIHFSKHFLISNSLTSAAQRIPFCLPSRQRRLLRRYPRSACNSVMVTCNRLERLRAMASRRVMAILRSCSASSPNFSRDNA